jgi:hypothetical protein
VAVKCANYYSGETIEAFGISKKILGNFMILKTFFREGYVNG